MTRGPAYHLNKVVVMLMAAVICSSAIAATTQRPFILPSVTNSRPYVGEEALLTYTLYFKDLAPKISNEENPSFKGLWAKETGSGHYIKSTPAVIKGERLRGAVIKQFRISPLEKGPIRISGYTMLCLLPREQEKDGAQNLPDIRLSISAPDLSIWARALPEPAPAGFSGAVGTFRLELLADRERLKVGEPIILKLLITGTGSLLTLKPPTPMLPESFRQSTPESTTSLQSDREGNTGAITLKITAWPQSSGSYTIPPLTMDFFNPTKGRFEEARSNALVIRVITAPPAREIEKSNTAASSAPKEQKNSTALIFGAIASLLLVIGAGVLLAGKRLSKESLDKKEPSSPEQQSQQKESVGKLKQQLLQELEQAGINGPGGLTRKELDIALQNIGTPDEARTECSSLLDTLDRLLYTPAGKEETAAPEIVTQKVHGLLVALKALSTNR
ncbi:MAG: BatD family protein [Chlorobiaceae bacterium]